MIYVTHDQVEAMTLADRIVLLREGVIEQQGAPLDLFERPGDIVRRRVPRLTADELHQGQAGADRWRHGREASRRRAEFSPCREDAIREPARAPTSSSDSGLSMSRRATADSVADGQARVGSEIELIQPDGFAQLRDI